MPKTKEEKLLLKRLAESYAFVFDLRQVAINRGDSLYIRKTEGIGEAVAKLRKEYPKTFQRYFRESSERIQKYKEKQVL